jgi:hypothetical protein
VDAADATSRRLQEFLSGVATPVQPPLIATPQQQKKKKLLPLHASPRRSGRLATKKKARQLCDSSDAIQELIARVCGLLAPASSFDDASRAAYQQMFMQAPLAGSAIQALEALIKQVKKLKKLGGAKTKSTNVVVDADV